MTGNPDFDFSYIGARPVTENTSCEDFSRTPMVQNCLDVKMQKQKQR